MTKQYKVKNLLRKIFKLEAKIYYWQNPASVYCEPNTYDIAENDLKGMNPEDVEKVWRSVKIGKFTAEKLELVDELKKLGFDYSELENMIEKVAK